MSKPGNEHAGVGILHEVPGLGILQAYGTAAPTNGVAGYANSCTWQHIGGAADSNLFINEGTLASATWVASPT